MAGFLTSVLFWAVISGCSKPLPNRSVSAEDGRHWVDLEQCAANEKNEELLPTQRLRLKNAWRPDSLVLVEGVETMCGTDTIWKSPKELVLRLPGDRAEYVKVKDGQTWDGVKVLVQLHDDLLVFNKPSSDGQRRLVVIQNCETESWNLYLRRAGEPTYNKAMKTGWDDPDVFGGFEFRQPALSLDWIGPRSAVVKVPGKLYGVTLREKIDDVTVKWVLQQRMPNRKDTFITIKPNKVTSTAK
jgi:hypothetical protein